MKFLNLALKVLEMRVQEVELLSRGVEMADLRNCHQLKALRLPNLSQVSQFLPLNCVLSQSQHSLSRPTVHRLGNLYYSPYSNPIIKTCCEFAHKARGMSLMENNQACTSLMIFLLGLALELEKESLLCLS